MSFVLSRPSCCIGAPLTNFSRAVQPVATPPFFRLAPLDTFDQWLKIGFRLPSRGGMSMVVLERELLAAWRALSEQGTPGEVVDIRLIKEEADRITGKSRDLGSFSRALQKHIPFLMHAGILTRSYAREKKGSRSMLYEIRSAKEVAQGWVGGARDSQIPRVDQPALRSKRPFHNDQELQDAVEAAYSNLIQFRLVPPSRDQQLSIQHEPWTLGLISQLIERCTRSNARQHIESVSAVIRIGDEPVRVESHCIHPHWNQGYGYGVVAAEDGQLILAIITTAMKQIELAMSRGEEPSNRISYDLMELAQALYPDAVRTGYQALQKGMARLINTEFYLQPTGEYSNVRRRFRIVEDPVEGLGQSHGVVIDGNWAPDSDLRYCSFRLNDSIWQSLLEGKGWLVHDQLLYEREGLIHKLYHHLRQHAGKDQAYIINATELMAMLNVGAESNPSLARQRFIKRLWQVLKEHARRHHLMLGLPDVLELETELPLFDIRLVLKPSVERRQDLTLMAYQSDETQMMLLRQEERNAEIRRRFGATYDGESLRRTDLLE